MKTGRLVTICGIDGSGKTAQAKALTERAREEECVVENVEFPRYGQSFFGELIARYLRGEFGDEPGQVNPYLASLPFACDRWEAAPMLRGWIEEGKLVVANRYVPANLAHQGAKIASDQKRQVFFEWVQKLEYDVFGLPHPDLHVWLDMPPSLAQNLVGRKHERDYLQGSEDIHERDLAYLEATRAVYLSLARNGPAWTRIECAPDGELLPVGVIAEKVWSAVSGIL